MKTAIEWLYNELSKNNTSIDSVIERINKDSSIWKQAKQMEKEQIIEAHTNGHNDSYEYHFLKNSANEISLRNGEEYYNQTFKPETI